MINLSLLLSVGLNGLERVAERIVGPDQFRAVCGRPRHPEWPRRSAAFRKGKRCVVCGRTVLLETHHVYPYNLYPELEMVEEHWRVVCRGEVFNCHLGVGHLGDWQGFNPNFDADAAAVRAVLAKRPEFNRKPVVRTGIMP